MDWILTRETVIALAVLGAVFSTAASLPQVRGIIGAPRAKQLNLAGYVAMAISMALFIIAGFRS